MSFAVVEEQVSRGGKQVGEVGESKVFGNCEDDTPGEGEKSR
jgi:hypothetical protein